MKSIRNILVILSIVVFTSCQSKQEANTHHHDSSTTSTVPVDTIKKSIPKEAHAQVGAAHITIKYHAPAVRGRIIWGGLVHYGEVWVTGAHNATSFEIDKNFIVNEKEIPAGKYALFTIPGKEKWTIIINKNWDQHLADEYDQKEDVIRLEVTPEITQDIQERLKYTINTIDQSQPSVDMSWEKVRIGMPFKVK